MERVWLKNYPPDVPSEIDPDRYQSLNEIFEESCRVFSKNPAYVNLGKTLSYAELEEKTRAFANFLKFELKLKKGERIALMMPNILQYPIALFAALRAGLIVVNVNPLYTPRELEYQLYDAGCKAIVVLASFAHTVQKTLPLTHIQHVIVTDLGDLFSLPKAMLINFIVKYIKKRVPTWSIPNHVNFKEALEKGKTRVFQAEDIKGDDVAFLQYTGGTTGIAKGAILTHRNMVANLEQASAWIKPSVTPGKEIIITPLPLYHIFSLTANCLIFMKIGALNVLITNPRDIKSFIKEMAKYRFTAITGVNTLFNALLQNKNFAKLDFSHLKIALGGGMSIQQSVAERWKLATGVPLIEAYGLTETCPAVCINPLNIKDYNASIGLPVPSTDISIRNDEDQELDFNEAGELWVKGPQVMRAYWQKPSETQYAVKNDWLRTGDIATVDEKGYVRIVDRKKDMILVSGFNVYPNEVEGVIAMMPEVSEVAVVGVSLESEERVKAFIVKRNADLTEEKIIQHCRKYLTGYKIPKAIEFRNTLPKTPVGKILRRALRDENHSQNT